MCIWKVCWKCIVLLKFYRVLVFCLVGFDFCFGGKVGVEVEGCILFEGEFEELLFLVCWMV